MIQMKGETLDLDFDQVCRDQHNVDPSDYVLVITGPSDRITVHKSDDGRQEIRIHGYAEAYDFLNACGLVFDLSLKETKQ